VAKLADAERIYEVLLSNLQTYRESYKDKAGSVEEYVAALKSLNDFMPEGMLQNDLPRLPNVMHCRPRGQSRRA
jgi:hypothetical protein